MDGIHFDYIRYANSGAGIGSWHISVTSTVAKIGVERALGAQRAVLFSYGGVTHDGASEAYLNTIATHCFQGTASLPTMAWLAPRPAAQAEGGVTPTEERARSGG